MILFVPKGLDNLKALGGKCQILNGYKGYTKTDFKKRLFHRQPLKMFHPCIEEDDDEEEEEIDLQVQS